MPDPDVVEFDQRRGVRLLRRRWMPIVAVTIILAAIGAGYGWHHRSYSATASVLVATPIGESLPGTARTSTDAERAVANETQYLQSTSLQQKVANILGRKTVSVSVNPVSNADVVELTASAGTAANAQKIANTYARTYVRLRTTDINNKIDQVVAGITKKLTSARAQLIALSRPHAGNTAALRQTIISEIDQLQVQQAQYQQAKQIGSALPSLQTHATQPSGGKLRTMVEYGLIGAALGLLIGIFLASRLERSRPKVIDAADVTGLGANPVRVFSMVAREAPAGAGRGAAIRSLAGWLLAGTGQQPGRIYLLLAADGHSNRALLADLREQAALFGRRLAIVSTRFGETAPGDTPQTTLEQLLNGSSDSEDWLLSDLVDERSGVTLEAGASEPSNGKAALDSAPMRDVLRQLSQSHGAVLVDAADVDACLLVANAAPEGAECLITLAPHACRQSEVALLFDELGVWGVPVPAVIFRHATRFQRFSPRRAANREPVPNTPVPSRGSTANPPELGS